MNKKWIKLGWRNLLKNNRRTLAVLLAISIGYAAISLFRGYTKNTFEGLRNSAIKGEGLGHLTLFKKNWETKGKIDPENHMFSKKEIILIKSLLHKNSSVELVTPRLIVSGLITNGEASTIFIGIGVIPEEDSIIKGDWGKKMQPVQGQPLSSSSPMEIEMAEGLVKILNFDVGGQAVLMGTTLSGQMNALDADIDGIYNTRIIATNDKFIRLPFQLAQSLYDTENADRLVILLDDWEKTWKFKDNLTLFLKENNLSDIEIKTWDELSLFYSQAVVSG